MSPRGRRTTLVPPPPPVHPAPHPPRPITQPALLPLGRWSSRGRRPGWRGRRGSGRTPRWGGCHLVGGGERQPPAWQSTPRACEWGCARVFRARQAARGVDNRGGRRPRGRQRQHTRTAAAAADAAAGNVAVGPHAHPGVVATRCHLSPPHHSPPSPAVVGERAPPLRAMTHQPPPSPSSPVVAATVATLPCACLPGTLPDVLVTTVGAGRRRGVAQLSPSPPQLLDHPPTRHSPPAVCLHVRPSLCRRCVVEGRVVASRGDSSFRCSRYDVQLRTLVTLPESEAGRMGIVEEAGEESGTATRGEVGSDGGPRRATQGGRTRARGVASQWGKVPPHTRSPGGVSTLRLTPPTRSDPLNSAPLRPTPLV